MEHFFVVLSGLNPAIRCYLLRQTLAQKDIHYYPGQTLDFKSTNQQITKYTDHMSLSTQIMEHIKDAMRAKDTVALEALRAIKSELLLAQTASGNKEDISEAEEIKLLQKLVKTRKDSANIFTEQNRMDLAEPELAQIAVIEKFLPAQLSEAEVELVVAKIIAETGASGIASMGKVMGIASAQLGGTAEGKTISTIVKKLLV
jgi:uncharacterized protein YqeY